MSSNDTILNRGYQYVDPLAKPNPLARTPQIDAASKKRAIPQSRNHVIEKEVDWEVVSDASGTEDNGTEQVRQEQEHKARLERQTTWQSDQKARKKEQLAVNNRVIKEDQERDSRKKARKESAATGQESGETKAVPNSWLRMDETSAPFPEQKRFYSQADGFMLPCATYFQAHENFEKAIPSAKNDEQTRRLVECQWQIYCKLCDLLVAQEDQMKRHIATGEFDKFNAWLLKSDKIYLTGRLIHAERERLRAKACL
ncbi:hypothetical protein BCR34DRAFT_598393 [Clohesyomyces aquaticus]|uniref:Uncharacterized protein n=1 Tax=Clohesyomyces aquaticus TaxID=1231657 RepID=A0A1Y1ZYS7_9PLEO|nr:hypothetical protein BCR34DRAFT_598393 [Clohesyomyces aquaticus]